MNAPNQPWALDNSYIQLIFPITCVIFFGLRKIFDKAFLFLLLPSFCYLIVLYNADAIVGFHDRHFLTASALLLPLFVLSLYHILHRPNMAISPNVKTICTIGLTLLFGYFFNTAHYTLKDYQQEVQRTA